MMTPLLNYTQILADIYLWGNSMTAYIRAILGCVLIWLILQLFELRLLAKLKKLATQTTTTLDDAFVRALLRLKSPFYGAISVMVSIQFLVVPPILKRGLSAILVVVIVSQCMKAIASLMDSLTKTYTERAVSEGDKAHAAAMFRLLRGGVLIIVWLIIGVSLLANMGINVTSIVASLGIGGIAIALAVQNILGDIFSSFSIFIDKPFQVGDFISIGDQGGTVKYIGLKTTRIKLLQGEELVVPNKTLTSTNIQNFRQLKTRRVSMTFGVVYETPGKKLRVIPEKVEKIVSELNGVTFSRCHLSAFADSSIDFELIYLIDDSDYELYMDRKQDILLAMLDTFAKEKIDFAYPTQVVYVKK